MQESLYSAQFHNSVIAILKYIICGRILVILQKMILQHTLQYDVQQSCVLYYPNRSGEVPLHFGETAIYAIHL